MIHKLNTLFTFLAILMLANVGNAQQRGCVQPKYSEKEELNYNKAMAKIQHFGRASRQAKAAGTYKIPVVFHILHNGGGQVSQADMQCRIDDVLKTVNGDFNGTFPGFNQVDPRFASIKDKMDIEFVAATVDPEGNTMSTPGMDWQASANIAYGYNPKIYDYIWWGKKNKYYLDVVVVDAPNKENETNGSGHAFLPVQEVVPHVAYNWRYVGSTCGSASTPGFEKIMTHEFGHYFGLKHTFNGDCSADNDGIADTPPTTQAEGCERNKLNNCGVYANLENHMDYNTSCQNMFTQDQVTVMTFWLDDTNEAEYPRAKLWQDSNLSSVGVINRAPIANFTSNYTSICQGKSITFEDLSLGVPTSWSWQFQGGTPATSTSRNPVVTYQQPGVYRVRLTATNSSGQNTEDRVSYVYVNQTETTNLSENFQGDFPISKWGVTNPDKGLTWEKSDKAGNGDGFCIIMNNADNATTGEEDFLELPSFDFTSASNSELSFDVAYTKFDDASPDVLKVQVSTNCGTSWTDVYSKTHTELETKRVDSLSNGWIPKVAGDWRKEIVDLSNYDGNSRVAVRFKNISGYGTRIWVDNVKVILNNNTPPISEFFAKKRVSNCASTEIDFQDTSTGKPTSWNWTFEGGTPATSTAKNPKVIYTTPGSHTVTLTTTNANGSSITETKNGYITIATPTTSTITENFAGNFPPTGWQIINNDGEYTWEKRNDVGNGDSSCMIMNNADNETVGTVDEVILNPLDLTGGASFKFDIAYAKFDDVSKDKLKILASTNCGTTWTEVYSKDNIQLETFAAVNDPDTWINEINLWKPTTAAHWRTENVSLDQFKGNSNVLIKFQNTSGFGNIIWIDNINFTFDAVADTQAPTAPSNLTASNVAQTTVSLNWTASTDNTAVTGYDVYRGTTKITTVTSTSYNVTGLTAGTAYTFSVKAKDAAGNVSTSSNIVNVTTTQATDTQAPTAPGNLVASNVAQTTLSLNWTASTDNTAVTGYDVYRGSTKLTTVTATSYNVTGLTAGTAYTFSVKAKDAAGNESASSNVVNVTTNQATDTQAPTAPSNLTASNVAQTTVSLNWTASTDNTAVTGYDVYRGATKLTTVTATSYNVTGLTAGTAYTFSVKAKDAAGNESASSNTVNVTTTDGTIPTPEYCTPTAGNPSGQHITNVTIGTINNNSGAGTNGYTDNTSQIANVSGSASLSVTPQSAWGATKAKAWVDWNKDGDFEDVGEEVLNKSGSGSPYTATVTVPSGASGSVVLRVRVAYSNDPTPCGEIYFSDTEDYTLNLGGSTVDTQAPTVPTNLVASNVTETTLSLNWTASTDNTGVTGYDVYRGNTKVGTVTSTSYNVTGLTAGTSYAFSVKAKDAAGNESASSNTINVTTNQAVDTQAPTAPANLTASNVAQTTLSLNWTASSDNVGVTGYDVYRGATRLGTVTSTSYNVSGLTANTSYTFSVKAKDAAGNESASSNLVNVTTSGTTIPTPTYCAATGNGGPEAISNVTFAGINKSSVRNASGYEDHTASSATVGVGTSHNLKVTIIGYQTGSADEIYAWFDWNQNGDFTDAGEYIQLNKTTNLEGNISVTVPQTAKAGATRMRVLVSYYNNENNPCDTGSNDVRYGEYEDYTVNVTASKSLNLTGTSGKLTISPNPISNGVANLYLNTVESGTVAIQFYNSTGVLVGEFNRLKGTEQSITVQLGTQFKTGLYLIRAQFGSREYTTKVLVD